ncbi:MAG: peptidoglycan-binding protein [Oscillatoriales cyanobacterium]|uniref:peptidoglycan-binding domain-containing protein n=1 Tax=Microcoleus anatoxicus TaxID=2705319 RepID=UPI0030C9BBC9|nr:MAG: peptidoglycan-binding protein [Oscillatoriales cyanobacterium]
MESLAYLELALADEAPTESPILEGIKWKYLSSHTYFRLLSLALILSVVSAASSAFAQINPGNPNVRSVQDRLRQLGYFNRSSTGQLGPLTQQALTNFQRDYQLSLTGRPDRDTVSALNSLGVKTQAYRTVDTNNYRELRFGDKGEDVLVLQRQLQQLGYFTTNPTGTFGRITQEAVTSFQQINRLSVTGVADSQTLALLLGPSQPQPTTPIPGVISGNGGCRGLRFGDRGATVDLIQRQLKDLGYFKGPVDGKFRERTLYAVTRFQQDNFLVTDGCADTATLIAIDTRRAEFQATFFPRQSKQPNFVVDFLKFGDTGRQVEQLQQRLQVLRYYAGPIHGLFDRATEAALIRFQTANRLSGTGKVDRQTQGALQQSQNQTAQTVPPRGVSLPQVDRASTVPISISSRSSIYQLQRRLRDLSFYNGPISGVLDAPTQAALDQAQRSYRVSSDDLLTKTF